MANKPISTLPEATSIPDGSILPMVMGDGTGTKQVTKELLKKEVGGSDPENMIATTKKAGTVKPDGKTIVVEEDGTIRCEGTAEVLHLPAGKANHCPAEKGDCENDVKRPPLVREPLETL